MMNADVEQMTMIRAIKRKIDKDGAFCPGISRRNNTWRKFKKAIYRRNLILYGAGEMFEYFCRVYGKIYDVSYAVDQNIEGEKNGVKVRSVDCLKDETVETVILVTVINEADIIFERLRKMGFRKVFSLPVMEWHRIPICFGVCRAKWNSTYDAQLRMYYELEQLRKKNERLERRINGIQQRQTQRYRYLEHTNTMLNVLIDKRDDLEMKKEQIRYIFTEIYENQYEPDFENPRSFNEKTLAKTLYDHNPLYTEISDKYTFKKYVSDRIGERYVVPLLGVWDSPEDIDFARLPDQFALKSTVGGDSKKVILVKDKGKEDLQRLIRTMQSWYYVYRNDYYGNFNWQFKNMKQRYIAEKLLDIEGLPYYDFKVHCFHGEPKYIHVVWQNPHELAHYDTEWNRLNIVHGYPDLHCDIPKPDSLEEILEISRTLSKPFDYVRVDFYVLKNRLYVGELTLTTMGGLKPFVPVETDYEWGDLI